MMLAPRIKLFLVVPTGGPYVLAPNRCPSIALLLLSIALLAALLGLLLKGDLSGVRALTDWPVGDCATGLVTEGGVERSGSVYGTF